MRFLTLLKEKSVPQWWTCYYDYENMKILISIAAKGHNILVKMEQQRPELQEQNENLRRTQDESARNTIREIVQQTNELFFRYHFVNKKIVFLFVQLKIHELTDRLQLYEKWESKVEEKMDQFLILIFNLFYETRLLNQMCQIHMEAYKKIQKKHIRAFQIFHLDSPFFRITRLKRSIDQLGNYSQKLAQLYHKHKEIQPRIAKKQLEEQMVTNLSEESVYSYLFGFINGINIPLIILPFIILQLNEIKGSRLQRLQMQSFLWWTIAYSTLYIWIAAGAFKIFENNRINYQLVFNFEDQTKKSYWPLGFSSISTLLLSIFFNIYVLNITEVNNQLISSEEEDIYFPFIYTMIVLLAFAVFSIIKKPYCILPKIIFDLLTPCFGVQFRSIWLTEQFITFIQPIALVGYLFCYTFSTERQSCGQSRHIYNTIAEGFAILFFFIRFIQTVIISFQNGKFWKTPQMFIVIRCFLNIIIVTLSILSVYQVDALIAWICLAVVGVTYNYWLDFYHDWDLSSSCFTMKRQSAIIKEKGFIPFRIGYFLLRTGWIVSICPNITYMISPQVWPIIAVGVIQLIRRLLWNILRVEKEHLNNCKQFRVKNDNIKKENEVKKEIQVHNLEIMEMEELSIERSSKEKETIYDMIDQKNDIKKEVISWSEEQLKKLTQLETDLFD